MVKNKLLREEKSDVEVRKEARTLKDIFGTWKNCKLDAQKINDELRREDAERDKRLSRLICRNRCG